MKDTETKAVRNGKPPGISRLRGAKLIVFGWYGGKFSHLDWLLPLLPMTPYYLNVTSDARKSFSINSAIAAGGRELELTSAQALSRAALAAAWSTLTDINNNYAQPRQAQKRTIKPIPCDMNASIAYRVGL
jgi:hypothetical protein